jgi:aminomethyltransferase
MKTALYERHVALGAKMVDFSGWEMPIQYAGILAEHHTVRGKVGIFDVSHMGRIVITGEEAESFLDYISTNRIAEKPDFSAIYTVWSSSSGGSIDDVLIYKESPHSFFVIVNAGNRHKDLNHLRKEGRYFKVKIEDRFNEGILSVQGPLAEALVAKFFSDAAQLKPMHFMFQNYRNESLILSKTGYTGAGGYEIFASSNLIVDLWDQFLKEGQEWGIQPIGLGARDTLRLEMGYALYGHELNDNIAVNESVSVWTLKMNKPDFLGKSALNQLEQQSRKRHEYGIILIDKGIAREGYEVFKDDQAIGYVTSGTLSPTLNKAIAIIIVRGILNLGDYVEVQIRQNRAKAQVVKLPFLEIKV